MERGIQARGGMGRIVSMTGVSIYLKIGNHPTTMPNGTAITKAKTKPEQTRRRLSKQWRKRLFPVGRP